MRAASRRRGDPLLLLYGLILLVTAAVGLSPLVEDPYLRSDVISFADLPLAALLATAFMVARTRSVDTVGRRSWLLFAATFVFLMPVHVLGNAEESFPDLRLDLLQEVLFLGYYLCASLALELLLCRSASAVHWGAVGVRLAGTTVFVLGLFVYFVAIPGLMEREVYNSFVPSFFLYIILDLYLAVRLLGLMRMSEAGAWRRTFVLFLIAFGMWTLLDSLELLYYTGLYDLPLGGPLDLLWCLPYLPLLVGVRQKRPELSAPAQTAPFESRTSYLPFLITQPLSYAVFLPLLHFLAYSMDWAALEIEGPREVLLLILLPVLAILALLHHHALEKQNLRLAEEREEVAQRAQSARRMESIGRLAGGIAHDFNNLLQVIRGSTEVLSASTSERSPSRRHLTEIRESVDRAARLTDQLLAVGRRKRMDPQPVLLNEVVLEGIGIIDRVIGDRVRVQLATHPEAGWVLVDRSQLDQAVLNLAINARDAMPEGGTLSLETDVVEEPDSTLSRWSVLRVLDTGCGMEQEVQARIFEPFFTTKNETEGSGLGLSMVYGFVSQSGGRIDVESELGVGTRITLWFPSRPPAAEETPGSQPRSAEGEAGGGPGGAARIVLLVEDEENVRAVIRELLAGCGYAIVEASDGSEALRLLGRGLRPDVLLTDVQMPGLSAREFVTELRKCAPGLPILFMTGHAGTSLASPELHGIAVLEKPFTRRALLQRLTEALAASSSGAAAD